MTHRLIGVAALAAMIAGGSAFAADMPSATTPPPAAPAAMPAPMPAAPAAAMPAAEAPAAMPATAMPATAMPAATAAPAAAMPATMPAMAAKKAMPHVSACTKSIESAEHALKMSKAKPEDISGAWQHVQAAKDARKAHNGTACKSEAMMASKML